MNETDKVLHYLPLVIEGLKSVLTEVEAIPVAFAVRTVAQSKIFFFLSIDPLCSNILLPLLFQLQVITSITITEAQFLQC
ncbi:hypothetical protein GXP67_00305 [Rhodocytophaga rosea]|uniref:Uncharacterized protein n=1 Tax=Rhodocytophaga rosea TaxID=2704465 RepID=A0A6C0GBK2_9BACT|nr:hypothetical protein [Rhodocytophaga rosea]QHT65223.1 hypothetical protein GXP67_00305 [Rhodocytophaga rosea]